MKKLNYITGIFIVSFFVVTFKVIGQETQTSDSVRSLGMPVAKPELKVRKNTILVNVTNPSLISTRFFTVTYERILPNNQSFSVGVGSFSLPRFLSDVADSLGINTDYSDKGFHFSCDYRFYLKKENKYSAPRGIYIGPYYAYNHLTRGVNWQMDGQTFNGDVLTDLKLNIHTIGFELGYQFVFWDKLAVDMILIGPGFGSYGLNTVLNTTLSPDQESEFFERLNNYLENHIPGYEWVIKPGEFKKNGSYNTWDLGYRYSIRIGYRF